MREILEPLRGFRDYIPPDSDKISWICSSFSYVARRFGYREIRTPTVENFKLFALKSGEEIKNSMFVFKDKAGREVALRPEVTPSVIRVYLREMRTFPKPIRLFYIANVFRYDEPQFGRYREFTQAGVEILGGEGLNYDIELVEVLEDFYDLIGLRERVYKVNNVAIFRELAKKANLSDEEVDRMFHLLDKGRFSDVEKMFTDRGAVEEARLIHRLSEVREYRDLGKVVEIFEGYSGYRDLEHHVEALKRYVDMARAIGANLYVDPAFARGIAYYTGIIFEVLTPHLSISIAGGGRYDNLSKVYGGEDLASTGFAIGVERTLLALESSGIRSNLCYPRILVLLLSEDVKDYVKIFSIVKSVRKRGIPIQFESLDASQKLSRWLEYASKQGFNYVVIVGKRELEKDVVLVRDMSRWMQEEVALRDLEELLVKYHGDGERC